MTQLPHVTALEPTAAREYLINVADTLANAVVPALEGRALTRANECITMIARLAARMTAPNAPSRDLLAELGPLADALKDPARAARIDGAIIDAEEAEMTKVQQSLAAKGQAGQRRYDQPRLQAFLRAHALGSPQLTITDSLELQGGRSKLTVKVTTQDGTSGRLPRAFILRQDWGSSVTGASVVPEFEILKRVHAAGVRVPEPFVLEAGSEATGAPFLLVGCVDGKGEGDIFDPPPSESLGLELAAQVGKLHAMGARPFEGLPGVAWRSSSAEQVRTEIATFRGVIDQLGDPCATASLALDWAEKQAARVEGPRSLVHGDLGFHNFLVHRGELTALLDWELAHLGNPAEDLGYARPWIERMTPWDRFMKAYRAAGGAAVSEEAVDFFAIWGSLRLYFMLLQARAAITSGMLRDCEITLCSVHFLPYVLHRMSRDLRKVLGVS